MIEIMKTYTRTLNTFLVIAFASNHVAKAQPHYDVIVQYETYYFCFRLKFLHSNYRFKELFFPRVIQLYFAAPCRTYLLGSGIYTAVVKY